MAKKNLPAPFDPAICQRLRKLVVNRANALKRKKSAEEARDEIVTQMREVGDQPKKLEELKAQWADEMFAIERYKKVTKHIQNQITETIENGDQPELFEHLNANPTLPSLFKEMAAEADDDTEDEDDEDESGEGAEERELAGATS